MIKLTQKQAQSLSRKIAKAKNQAEIQSVTNDFYSRLEALQRAKHAQYAQKISNSKLRTQAKIKTLIGSKSNIGDFIKSLNQMSDTHIQNIFRITLLELRDILNESFPRY